LRYNRATGLMPAGLGRSKGMAEPNKAAWRWLSCCQSGLSSAELVLQDQEDLLGCLACSRIHCSLHRTRLSPEVRLLA